MRTEPLDLRNYKSKPEEFHDIMLGYFVAPGHYFVYLKQDHQEIMAMLENDKKFVTIYGVEIQKAHILKIEDMCALDTIFNQSQTFLHAEMKLRFDKFKQDNGREANKQELIDITIGVMNEAQSQVATQTDEQIDVELAEAKKSIPAEQ